MVSAQVVKTSVNTNNSPSQEYTTNPDYHSNHNINIVFIPETIHRVPQSYYPLRPVSTSANLAARTGTIACSSIEKKQSDWLLLILVAKKLNLIQFPELTARSPVNARGQIRRSGNRPLGLKRS